MRSMAREMLRAALAVVLAAVLVQGCTRTVYYAVLNPRAPADEGRCFRDCQPAKSAGTKQYLRCVQSCPGTRVLEDEQCATVAYGTTRFECTTEHNRTFSPMPFISGIVLGVILFFWFLFFGATIGA